MNIAGFTELFSGCQLIRPIVRIENCYPGTTSTATSVIEHRLRPARRGSPG